MSLKSLLNHRCDLYELVMEDNDGSPVTYYKRMNDTPVRCRLDLSFLRNGRDSLWTAAARPTDRMGVMFFLPSTDLKTGMRVVMVKGPQGSFELVGSIDEAYDFDSLSHYEVGVQEVSSLQYRGSLIKSED